MSHNLQPHARGITITLPRSKTDQEGHGWEVEIARGCQPENTPLADCTCPVRALDQWLRQAGIESGPLFRKVNRGGKRAESRPEPGLGGVDPEKGIGAHRRRRPPTLWRAHSLRAGFAATAFDTGVPEFKIRQQTGHKTSRMLEKYIRSEQKARQEAASSLGL
jgi:integrase